MLYETKNENINREKDIKMEISDHIGHHTSIIMNDENKALHIEYDHLMKKLNIICDNVGVSIRGNLICDQELDVKFGQVLDHFGIQDGDTRIMTSNHQLIKDLINMIMDKFLDSCF
jgi:hypothetical protein